MNYADKLRELANWLDSHTEIRDCIDSERPFLHISADSPQHFGQLCRAAGPRGIKGRYNETLEYGIRPETEDGDSTFSLRIMVSGVCEQVPALDDLGNPKVRVVPASPERVEQVYEWKCPDSFLALADD